MKIFIKITPMSITPASPQDAAKGIQSVVHFTKEQEKKGLKETVIVSIKSNVLLDAKTHLNKLLLCEVEYPKAIALSQFQSPSIFWRILTVQLAQ